MQNHGLIPSLLLLGACGAPAKTDVELRSAGEGECDEANDVCEAPVPTLAQRIDHIRYRYTRFEVAAYRTLLFDLIADARVMDDAQRIELLDAVTYEINDRGADGLEPLVMFLADAAWLGGGDARDDASALISTLQPTYTHELPAMGMLQPLAAGSSRLVLDVRPGVMRTLLQGLIENPWKLSLNALVDSEEAMQSICALEPMVPGGLTTDRMVELDVRRIDVCDNGPPDLSGGGGADSPGTGLVGGASMGGCLDLSTTVFGPRSSYDLSTQIADIEACLHDMSEYGDPDGILPSPHMGWSGTLILLELARRISIEASVEVQLDLTPPLTAGVEGLFDVIETYIEETNETERAQIRADALQTAEEVQQQAESASGLDAAILDTIGRYAKATIESQDAYWRAGKAANEYEGWREAVRDREWAEEINAGELEVCRNSPGCNEQTYIENAERLAARTADARKQRDDAKTHLEEMRDQLTEAKGSEAEARAQLQELRRQKREESGGQLPGPGEGSFLDNEACGRLATNGIDLGGPLDRDAMFESYSNGMWWINPLLWDPAPDQDVQASSAFGLPACGLDPTTRGGSLDCEAIAGCDDPSRPCGCVTDPSDIEANVAQQANAVAASQCAHVRCADDVAALQRGMMCTCGETEPADPPDLPPVPFRLGFFTGSGELVGTALQTELMLTDPLSLVALDMLHREPLKGVEQTCHVTGDC